jgi:hypothetical protein
MRAKRKRAAGMRAAALRRWGGTNQQPLSSPGSRYRASSGAP